MIHIKSDYGEAFFSEGEWHSDVDWWAELLNKSVPDDDDPRFHIEDAYRWERIVLNEAKASFRNIEVVKFKPEPIPEPAEGVVY